VRVLSFEQADQFCSSTTTSIGNVLLRKMIPDAPLFVDEPVSRIIPHLYRIDSGQQF
jgi:hypothetical protein